MLRSKVAFLQSACEGQDPDQPHRPVRRGPTYRRGSTRFVKESYQRYLNHDQWKEGILGIKIPFFRGRKELPFYRQLQGRPIFLIIHLFSGRRRSDDFHEKLASMIRGRPYDVHILSLDTAICKTIGNLAQTSETWSRMGSLLEKGAIAGGIAGPPCETFSAARYHEPSEEEKASGQRWPRPLRDEEWPWGLQDLSCRELRSIQHHQRNLGRCPSTGHRLSCCSGPFLASTLASTAKATGELLRQSQLVCYPSMPRL